MVHRLRTWLAPPIFETEHQTRIAHLLNTTLLFLFTAALIYHLFIRLNSAPVDCLESAVSTLVALLSAGVFLLLRRGYVELAAASLTYLLWLLVTLTVIAMGGVETPAFRVYFLVIVLAGLLLGRRGAVQITILSIVAAVCIHSVEQAGFLDPLKRPIRADWLIDGLLLLMVGLQLYLAARSMDAARERSRGDRALLADQNRRLLYEASERESTTRALQASEEKCRLLLESAPEAIILSDREGRILLVNDQAKKIFGYSHEEFIGRSIESLIPERFRVRHVTHRADYAANSGARLMGLGRDLAGLRKDGAEIPIEVGLSSIQTAEGLLIASFIADITGRKYAEQALLESQERFRLLLESAPEAIIITNSEGRIHLTNAQTERVFGYTRGEMIGRPVEMLMPSRFRRRHLTYRDVYLTAPSARMMGVGRDLLGLHKDGTEFPIEVSLSVIQTGEGVFITSIVTDITVRKYAEDMIVKSRDFYRTLLEGFPALIWQTDTDPECIYFNKTWLEFTGRTLDQEIGYGWVDGVHPDDRDRCLDVFRRAFEARKPFVMEYQLLHHSGEYRWVVDYGQPFANLDNEFGGFIGFCFDLSERKQVEEDMIEAERLRVALEKERELIQLKERFISVVSHEFRTPLSIIVSSAELVQRYQHRMTLERQQEHIREVISQSSYMTGLLEDILTINKARAGKLAFQPARMDLIAFCQNLLERIEGTDQGSHTFILVIEGDLGDVVMDVKLLQHIHLNLLTNAAKYSPSGGDIRFEVHRQADAVQFTISDPGIGIPPEAMERLYEPFNRADNTGSIGGTGLGLAIVKESVDLHGGTIACDSQVGVGTTFTVRLPAVSQPS